MSAFPHRFGPIETVASTGSTNADLRERALAGAAEGSVLVADEQTAGRGRWDRTWQTPARSGLAVSVLLRPSVPAASWGWLPLLVGLSAAAGVQDVAIGRAQVRLKWPNDVLVQERKLGGVLVERVETQTGPAAVAGLGVNISLGADQLPEPTATSLRLAGVETDRDAVLHAFLGELADRYDQWVAGMTPIEEYRAVCATLGRDVTVTLPGGEVAVGRALDVDELGRLVVDTDSGPTPFSSGEVTHLR